MSFLTSRAFTTVRAGALAPVSRTFATTALRRKTATETVKDTLKTVDRAVADKIVGGIEVGETVAQKAKEVAGVSTGEAKGKVSEMAGAAQGKASELSGEAKGKASEMTGKAKSAAAETKAKM